MDVYLLGAGFSSDAGVPTMKNFLDGVRDTAAAFRGAPEWNVLSRAADYAADTGSDNIEELLAGAINHPVFFDLIWAFGLTINHFSRIFLTRCQSGEDVGWYDTFARLVSRSGVQILTFNYDLVLEEILWWRTGCLEDYLLPFDEVRQPATRESVCRVPLYKLHGSISWLWCLSCGFSLNRCRHILSAAYEETPCPRCRARLIPLLIPPTFRKATGFVPVLRMLWERADLLFTRAERFIIGGFSFSERDADFRERFLAGLSRNRHVREVILVNRDESTCHAIGRFLPKCVPWKAIGGFPQFCEAEHKQGPG